MTAVAVIGPGRVGTAVAMALPDDYRVVAVAGRGRPALDAFVQRVAGAQEHSSAQAARRGELVLLCVPDDSLAGLVRALARDDAVTPGSRWVHVAGGHGTAVLRPARLAGAAVAACHPAQTFPDAETGRLALAGASWAVTADEPDRAWAHGFVRALGGHPVVVAEQARTLYHAALVVGANATAALVTLARELLLGAGIDDPQAFLAPLTTASAQAAAASGAAALTGPVRRGDAGTVAAHLAELRQVLPEAAEAYVAVSRLALRQSRRAGLDPAAAAAVEAVLQGD